MKEKSSCSHLPEKTMYLLITSPQTKWPSSEDPRCVNCTEVFKSDEPITDQQLVNLCYILAAAVRDKTQRYIVDILKSFSTANDEASSGHYSEWVQLYQGTHTMNELVAVVGEANTAQAAQGFHSVTSPHKTITLQDIQYVNQEEIESLFDNRPIISLDRCENLLTMNEFVMIIKIDQCLDTDGEVRAMIEAAERRSAGPGQGNETENRVIVAIELDTAEQSSDDPRDARMKQFFDWLLGQEWAEEFSADNEGIDIGVSGISTEEAKQFCTSEFGDIIDLCHFRTPSNGSFTFTGDSPSQATTPLKPGTSVQTSNQSAIYSGSIKSGVLPETGITVNHMFEPGEGSLISFENKEVIGQKILGLSDLCTDPHGKNNGRITADLCFLRIDRTVCRTRNELEIADGGRNMVCSPKIWKQQINSGINVLVIDQNGHLQRGTINKHRFDSKRCHLYDTMTVVDSSGSKSLTDEGDSGALVMYRDREDSDTIHVLGVVIGKWDGVDGSSMTIANKLHDVLSTVGRHTQYCSLLAPGADGTAEGVIMKDVDFATQ